MQSPKPKHDYEAIIDELSQNGIDVSNALIYDDHPLSSEFNDIFQFFQEALSVISSPGQINIEPSFFYFIDSSKVDACAHPRKQGCFRICVHRATVGEIFDLFCNRHNVLDDPELIDYKNLSNFFDQSSSYQSLDHIVFELSVYFICFHELGHLIQFSNKEYSNQAAIHAMQEVYGNSNKPFDVEDHLMEIDADMRGARFLMDGVINGWSSLTDDAKTHENLKRLIVLSLVGVFSFFLMVKKFPAAGIYYRETTHPHPLIRLMWLSNIAVERVKTHYPDLDSGNIIPEILRVLNIYSKYKNLGDIYEDYIDPYMKHSTEISDYLYSLVEISREPRYEYLAKS